MEATQEAALEGMLRKVQDKWIGVELTVKQYKEAKDAYILGSVEDIQAVLEDSLAVMATISSSRFVTGHLSLCQIICFVTDHLSLCLMICFHVLSIACCMLEHGQNALYIACGVLKRTDAACSAHVMLPVLNNSLILPDAALCWGL